MRSHPLALLLAPFQSAFSRPTWQRVVQLLEGTLLARGRRTVTAALRARGLQEERHFNLFHHVLSRARWSPLRISHRLLLLLVQTFVPKEATIEIVADETLERRWGPHIMMTWLNLVAETTVVMLSVHCSLNMRMSRFYVNKNTRSLLRLF